MREYIARHIESVVQRMSKQKPVIIITGARQVGKSTMLKKINKSLNYVTLNTALVRQQARDNPSIFFETYGLPIVVDEIQRVPELFDYVKDIVDNDDSMLGQFYLTGSQNFKLMKNVSDSLAGRAGIVHMLGLSFREEREVAYSQPFEPTKKHLFAIRDKVSSRYSFDKILCQIHKGSFPALYKRETDLKDWLDFQSSYFETYIERDVKEILKIQDEAAFVKFMRAVAARTGQQLNYAALAEVSGKDVKTMKSWMSVLQTCGLVYLLEPYYNNFNSRLVKTPKLYFLDTGLACYLGGWNTPQQLHDGAMWGNIFETWVVSEIIKSYYNDGRKMLPLYYYRDADKNEIDLVIENAGTLYPIEIKATSDPKKEAISAFRLLEKVPEKVVGEGAVICLAKDLLPFSESTWIVPVDLI